MDVLKRGGLNCCTRNRNSLLCSSIRIDFLRKARAGLATSYCTLELVFVVFSAQWKGNSNELPPANHQRVAFARIQEDHSVPHSLPKVTIIVNVIIIIPKIMIPIIFDVTDRSVRATLFYISRCSIDGQRTPCPSIVTTVIDLLTTRRL